MSLSVAKVGQRSSSSPGLLDLPVELLSCIIADVLEYVRNAQTRSHHALPQRQVCNVLCICSRIHKVAIPLLYKELMWDPHSNDVLANTLKVHPEYARHVRDFFPPSSWCGCRFFQEELKVTDAMKAALQGLPPSDRKMRSVLLTFPSVSLERAIAVLRALQPLRCHLIMETGCNKGFDDDDDDVELTEPNLAQVVRGDEPWLSRLTHLHLDGFTIDLPTIFLLSKLPNLIQLNLELVGQQLEPEAVESVELLLNGIKLERLFVHGYPLRMRRLVQQRIGVCIPTQPPLTSCQGDDRSTQDIELYQRVWHGCQEVDFYMKISDKYEHLPITAGERCPRCCVIANQVQIEKLSFEAKLSYAETGHITTGLPCSGRTTRYDLCKRHNDEIFGSKIAHDESNWLRRRALECMRWVLNHADESEEDDRDPDAYEYADPDAHQYLDYDGPYDALYDSDGFEQEIY